LGNYEEANVRDLHMHELLSWDSDSEILLRGQWLDLSETDSFEVMREPRQHTDGGYGTDEIQARGGGSDWEVLSPA
jgi:hypothetical protein